MTHQSELIKTDIHAYLNNQEGKSLLRFITCGSVDDGKSTLIGRLLWDSKLVFEDQQAALVEDSRKTGTQQGNLDYALLLDGLQAEREQGITIDVAYRFFSTDKRKFIVADTPGHEQYTRNMVTGASTAQAAVILIDARKGVLTQSRRHSYLVSLVGIRTLVLAINKMDLVEYSAARFEALRKEYELFAAGLGFTRIIAIPISALNGDNVIESSVRTPWYQGPTLLECLESVEIQETAAAKPFRMRVQWVNRPNLDFRGFSGTIVSGRIRPGDAVTVTASGQTSRVERIVTMDGDLTEAIAGQAVTLTLADEIDISRGDLLAPPDARPAHSHRYQATLVWLHQDTMQPGRNYLLKAGATTAPARVETLQHKINVNTLQNEPGDNLGLNEVGLCTLNISREISFDAYHDNRSCGSFILIDRMTNATVGAGMIGAALEATWNDPPIQRELQTGNSAALQDRVPAIVWLIQTGETGATGLAERVERKLRALGRQTILLDTARLRLDLNQDLDQSDGARQEEARRLLAVARLCADAGLMVLVSSHQAPPAGQDPKQITVMTVPEPAQSAEQQADNLLCSLI